MNATPDSCTTLGQSLWLDNITRDAARQRHAEALHRRAVGDRPHLEPDDLRQRDRQQRLPTTPRSGELMGRAIGRGAVLRAGAAGSAPRRRPVRAGPSTRPPASTAGCRWRCRRCSPTTPPATRRAGQDAAREGRPGRTCSSRSPARRKACRRSRRRSSPACRSTSRCCSRAEQYTAAADAYLRGIERRVAAGLDPDVRSVASLFISRWDVAVADKVPAELRRRWASRSAQQTYGPIATLLDSRRWQRLENVGARPQRLLFASTGTKDPNASDMLYISALAAPNTVNTMPEETLRAFADHGEVERVAAARRRRCASGARRIRQGRHRRRRAGRAAAERRRQGASSNPGSESARARSTTKSKALALARHGGASHDDAQRR